MFATYAASQIFSVFAAFLGRSYPESAASFAAKFAEGAIGKSGRKI